MKDCLKEMFSTDDLSTVTKEQIKEQAEAIKNRFGDFDKFEAKKIEEFSKLSYKTLKEVDKRWRNIDLPKDISLENLKNILKNNKADLEKYSENINVEEILSGLTEESKQNCVQILKDFKERLTGGHYLILAGEKVDANNYFDVDKKALKATPSDSTLEVKEYFDTIKQIMKQMQKSAALKWAGIGAAIIGITSCRFIN